MEQSTHVVRFLVGIVLLVELEETFKCCGVLGSGLPNGALAYLLEEQAVVVFLDEILQFVVLGGEALSFVVHHLLDRTS